MKNGKKLNWRELAKVICGCAFFMLICFETWWLALVGIGCLALAKLF